MMLYLAVALLVVAVLCFALASRQQKESGLPGGRVVYADTSHWTKVEKPLYDPNVGLTGKPDYLVEVDGVDIPVEVKSSRTQTPYDSHIYQVAAYCLLAHSTTGNRPPYGLLKYPDQVFAVDYTSVLEDALLDTIFEIQSHTARNPLPRSHESPRRCMRCGYREVCDQSLAPGPER